ncbi:hypothetical protein EVA_11305 [gut metagenome]|uniref:Uncharacterized protein n=1 Tax=gut metagenome TaxID=749906 RepID=J9G047_9ZZZZ
MRIPLSNLPGDIRFTLGRCAPKSLPSFLLDIDFALSPVGQLTVLTALAIQTAHAIHHFHPDITACFPKTKHRPGARRIHAGPHPRIQRLLKRKPVGQPAEQVLRTTTTAAGCGRCLHRLLNLPAKEHHLTPQVVLQTPAHKRIKRGVPAAAVRHIQHTPLEPGNHRGAIRQILVHPVLRQHRLLHALLSQLQSQPAGLGTVNLPACPAKAVDVRTQLLVKLRSIGTIHRHLRSDFALGNGAEVDTRQRSVRQHPAEILLALEDGGRRIPVEPHAHLLRDRCRTHTRLAVAVARVERQTHNLKLLPAARTAPERVKLVNLVQLRIEEMPVRLRHAHHKRRIRHVRINLLNH